MSAVPLYSSCFIWARLGGLMRHSAPELPSICAVTMSSGLYWLMNCMASCVEHASVRGRQTTFSLPAHLIPSGYSAGHLLGRGQTAGTAPHSPGV